MLHIAVAAVSAPALGHLNTFQKEFAAAYGQDRLSFQMFYMAEAGVSVLERGEEIARVIAGADLAIVDIMGAAEPVQDLVRSALLQCRGQRIVIGNSSRDLIRLGSFSMEGKKMRQSHPEKPQKNASKLMHTMRRMALMLGTVVPVGMTADMKNYFRLIDYWQQAGQQDIFSFMHLILRNYFGMKFLPKEQPCGMRYGIYLKDPNTEKIYDRIRNWKKEMNFQPDRPTVALLFYGHHYPNDFTPAVRVFAQNLEEDCNVLPIAFSQNQDEDLDTLEHLLREVDDSLAAIVNLMPFRLGAGPMGGDAGRAVEILEHCGVPYFKPFCLTKTEKGEWKDVECVNPGEFLISILLPELDGGIHTYPVGIVEKSADPALPEVSRIVPDKPRIAEYCSRIRRFMALQQKPNAEKKIALICYNYPAGEDNIFGGAFLDTFQSVAQILRCLKENGYHTDDLSAEELQASFCADGVCNDPQWADAAETEQYSTWNGERYPVRGVQLGNVFVGLQPLRDGGNPDAVHDKTLPASPEYETFYHWIQQDFEADAMVHIGTHGTLEFLPGKENGMTADCTPDRLVGEIPHFYFYYLGNPSEAMIAKRRSHAVLIGYQAPAYETGGLYGDYAELKQTIGEYRESRQTAPERCRDLLQTIQEQAKQLSLLDGPVTEEELDRLEDRLYEYECSLIPSGLHVIGTGLNREEAEAYAEQVAELSPEEVSRKDLEQRAMECRELQNLLQALSGRYLPVSAAGDLFKNPHLLPSGNNLVQFDPRLVPTRTAFARGAAIAEETLTRYCKEHGKWPESTAVILWGLETSKTQGETLGQILTYLGVGLKGRDQSFDSRFEIRTVEELGRPRIDVTIHICGFFRDMYPNLVENLNEVFRRLMERNETDEQSYFARNTRRNRQMLLKRGYDEKTAEEMARSRIFGPKAGEYGTTLTRLVREGTWEKEADLSAAFTDSLSCLYTPTCHGTPGKELLEQNYRNVQLMSQVRNNAEYELIDLDHYYEFYGGLAKSVESVRGKQAEMYVADTTGREVRITGLRESLERGMVTRLLNPRWIRGMTRHGYHGVQQIEKRFENVLGLAATTGAVDSADFSRMEQRYVEDADLRDQLRDANPWAYRNMLHRLLEADSRGYWQPSDEERETVQRVYLETEGEIER